MIKAAFGWTKANCTATAEATTSLAELARAPRPCSVLLISWYFPPDNTIASVRVGKMADFLEGTGHAIRVVTPDTKSDNPSLAVELDTRAIKRTRCFDLEACFNPAGRPHADLSTLNVKTPYFQLSLRRAKRAFESFYRNLILYPDKRVDWCLTLASTVDRLIRTERPDVILVSGPPFSAFLVAAYAGWQHHIPWIAEFRDRWVNDTSITEPGWRRSLGSMLERLLLRQAAGVVTVSSVWSRFYAGKYGLPTETVMDGFDPDDFCVDLDPPEALPLRLLSTDTTCPEKHDPTPLFEAIRDAGLGPDEIRVVFYGCQLDVVRALADDMGLDEIVEIQDTIPFKDAIALRKRADVLLLMQWNDSADEGRFPAKIFEYLVSNRQILGVGPPRGVPAALVRERRAGYFANEPNELANLLQRWIDEKRVSGRVGSPSRKAAPSLERHAQYQRLERFCENVVTEEKHWRRKDGPTTAKPIAQTLASRRFAKITSKPEQKPLLTAIIDTEAYFGGRDSSMRAGQGTESLLHQQRTQRLFDRYGVKPTYLIDFPIVMDPKACRVLKRFLDEGRADVGIQLHPWTNPPFDELVCERNSFPSNLPKALQRAKIERLIDMMERRFGLEPKVFKAGRCGFNDETALLLEELGLEIDTSMVPFTDFRPELGPNFEMVPHGPFWFGQERRLLELPVTQDLCGFLGQSLGARILPFTQSRIGTACHLPNLLARSGLLERLALTPEGLTLDDLKRLTRTLLKRGERLFTFVFHSQSVASGNTPYVRDDRELRAFLARIEGYLKFFTEDLGGEGRSAIALRDELLAQNSTALHPNNSNDVDYALGA